MEIDVLIEKCWALSHGNVLSYIDQCVQSLVSSPAISRLSELVLAVGKAVSLPSAHLEPSIVLLFLARLCTDPRLTSAQPAFIEHFLASSLSAINSPGLVPGQDERAFLVLLAARCISVLQPSEAYPEQLSAAAEVVAAVFGASARLHETLVVAAAAKALEMLAHAMISTSSPDKAATTVSAVGAVVATLSMALMDLEQDKNSKNEYFHHSHEPHTRLSPSLVSSLIVSSSCTITERCVPLLLVCSPDERLALLTPIFTVMQPRLLPSDTARLLSTGRALLGPGVRLLGAAPNYLVELCNYAAAAVVSPSPRVRGAAVGLLVCLVRDPPPQLAAGDEAGAETAAVGAAAAGVVARVLQGSVRRNDLVELIGIVQTWMALFGRVNGIPPGSMVGVQMPPELLHE